MAGYYTQPLPAKTYNEILKDFPPGSFISDVQTVNSRGVSTRASPLVTKRPMPVVSTRPSPVVYPQSQDASGTFLPVNISKTQSPNNYAASTKYGEKKPAAKFQHHRAAQAKQEYIPSNYDSKVESLPTYPTSSPASVAQTKYTALPQESHTQQTPIPTYSGLKDYRQPIIAKTTDGSKKKVYFEPLVARTPVRTADIRSPVRVANAPIRVPAGSQRPPLEGALIVPNNEFIARVRSPSGNVRQIPFKPIENNPISSTIQTEDEPNLQRRGDMDSKMYETAEEKYTDDRYTSYSSERQGDVPYSTERQIGAPHSGELQNNRGQVAVSPHRNNVIQYQPPKEPQPREIYRDERKEDINIRPNLDKAPEAQKRPQEYNDYYSSQKVVRRVFPRERVSKAMQPTRRENLELTETDSRADDEQNDNNPYPTDSEVMKSSPRPLRPPMAETQQVNQHTNLDEEDNWSLAQLKARREAELREQQHGAYYQDARGTNQLEQRGTKQMEPESNEQVKPVYNPDAPIPKTAFPTVIKHSYGPPRPSQGSNLQPQRIPRGKEYTAPVNVGPKLQTYAEIEKARMREYNQPPNANYRGELPSSNAGWYKGINRANKSQMRYDNSQRVRRSAIPNSGIDSKAGWKRGSIDSEAGWKR